MDAVQRRGTPERMQYIKRFGACLLIMVMLLGFVEPPRTKAFAIADDLVVIGAISILSAMGVKFLRDGLQETGLDEWIGQRFTNFLDETGQSISDFLDSELMQTFLETGRMKLDQARARRWLEFSKFLPGELGVTEITDTYFVLDGTRIYTVGDPIDFPNSGRYPLAFDYQFIPFKGCPAFTMAFAGSLNNFSVKFYRDGISASTIAVPNFANYVDKDFPTFSCSGSASNFSLMLWLSGAKAVPLYAGETSIARDLYPYLKSVYLNLPNVAVDIGALDQAIFGEMAEKDEYLIDGRSIVTPGDIARTKENAIGAALEGTLAVEGEVVKEGEVVEPEPGMDVNNLGLPALGAALTTRFPFSIPWDVYKGIKLLAAPPKTPRFEVDFMAPIAERVGGWKGSTKMVLDFGEYEIIGQVSRWASTIGFCLMLASGTKRLIWTG